jgi:hypothetical protein
MLMLILDCTIPGCGRQAALSMASLREPGEQVEQNIKLSSAIYLVLVQFTWHMFVGASSQQLTSQDSASQQG